MLYHKSAGFLLYPKSAGSLIHNPLFAKITLSEIREREGHKTSEKMGKFMSYIEFCKTPIKSDNILYICQEWPVKGMVQP